MEAGRCLRVLEGHAGGVSMVAWSADQRYALSGSSDKTVRLWDVETGRCLRVLEGHTTEVRSVAWSSDRRHAFSGDINGGIRVWDLSEFVTEGRTRKATTMALPPAPDQVQYTNAKVLLVGESGAGKTGLLKRLALNDWQPSDSTVGAWATQWKLPVASSAGVEREIWLWDFGGQADQRLIHQLYMDETALAVLVFDGQKEDLFQSLGQWDRDLTRASRKEFTKLLVAGRVDAGGLRVSRSEVETFAKERKFRSFLETSAKKNIGCEELKQAIFKGIIWDDIPCRTTEVLFKRLKDEIIRLKDAGRVLMRFNELRETLQLRLSGEFKRFTDEELRAVLSLLAGPGVVWELKFGSWVLLQPERINAYAQAVIRTLQADEHQRGCLMEERILTGDLVYESSMARLDGDEERFVLLAMHQTLVERGLCLRQPTDKGNLLIFPSYYRRERPELVSFPAVLVSYRFTGFLDEIYATLVVRLHHTGPFQQDRLWRYAADFKTNLEKQLGVKLTRCAPGMGELEVYFDPAVSMEEMIIFSKYVHEHLLQHAQKVERLRHYVCQHCGTPVGNREVAMKRLNAWLQNLLPEPDPAGWFKFRKAKQEIPSIICSECEKRVMLWDELEQCFASPEIQQRVRDMQEESAIVLDNESKERALVGEVISTVALAGQISREFNVSDHGIDMEIEFKDDHHEASGVKLYLQLKSGDSYLRKRRTDGMEVFTIKEERHAHYWMAQQFPVLLVIRNSEGEVRWMEVRNWLMHASDNGRKPVKQIVFVGERFDVMSVRRWREKALRQDGDLDSAES
jgi:small GTP-binding protein